MLNAANRHGSHPRQNPRVGFTLVELLVVIGIIAIMISLLLPALKAMRAASHKTRCLANLHEVVTGIRLYAQDNRDWTAYAPNYGLWEEPRGTPLKATDAHAYWGIAYVKYMANKRSLFLCPAAKYTDTDPGYSDNQTDPGELAATYGINGFITETKLSRFKRHGETIACQDAFEHKLDGNGDMLAIFPGYRQNLTQWRYIYEAPLAIQEYYRHSHQCNVAWLDGHVSSIKESLGKDVPVRWYTGE